MSIQRRIKCGRDCENDGEIHRQIETIIGPEIGRWVNEGGALAGSPDHEEGQRAADMEILTGASEQPAKASRAHHAASESSFLDPKNSR